MNKKADMYRLIVMIVILFAIAVSVVIFAKAFLDVTDELKAEEKFSNTTTETIAFVQDHTITYLDYLFFFAFVGLFIGLIISSMYISAHPAIFIAFFIVLLFVGVLAVLFSNVFVEIGETATLASTYDEFTYTKNIMRMLPLAILIAGVVSIIVVYNRRKGVEA